MGEFKYVKASAQCIAVKCNATQLQYLKVLETTTQHSTAQHSTAQHSAVPSRNL
jgi:hypothetical protein